MRARPAALRLLVALEAVPAVVLRRPRRPRRRLRRRVSLRRSPPYTRLRLGVIRLSRHSLTFFFVTEKEESDEDMGFGLFD